MKLYSFSDHLSQRLQSAGLDASYVLDIVQRAVLEDLAGGIDITSTSTVPITQRSIATFGTRANGCLAGLDVASGVIEVVCGPLASEFTKLATDGQRVQNGDIVARVEAPTQLLLTAERTALNIMCHMSGIATMTAQWVDAVRGTNAIIRDTRKTTPGLRALEKYAVRCGGGQNHRMALSDAALVKDNHIAAAGGVAEAFQLVRQHAPTITLEIEVDTLEQLTQAILAGANLVLLDNMSTAIMVQAVKMAKEHTARTGAAVVLEASGGLSIDRAKEVAQTGVDFISVGALTHSAPILDLGLDLETVL